MLRALTVAALIVPLAIDTFVLGTALGAAGVTKRERLRTSLIFTAFEAGMPVIGFLAGAAIGLAIGRWAAYMAAAVLTVTGVVMLWSPDHDDEERKVQLLESARGWAVVVLGLSISLDELAVGFGVGLLQLQLLLLVGLIAVQAFVAAQLGMRLGSHLAGTAKVAAGRIAGLFLLLAAVLVFGESLSSL